MITVAVDAMGGDDAPAAIVAGAIDASRGGLAIALVGARDRLESELSRAGDLAGLSLSIIEASEVVAMDEPPLVALRRKPSASVKVAAEVVARGQAHALFSAGHTGATVLAAHAAFGVLPGVERPALAVTFPTRAGAAVLLDAGANLECRAPHLIQFGLMGAAYARVHLGIAAPRVGLLSIGEEAGKGTELIREAHAGLAAAPIDFVGNVGAQDLFSGRADVVVCDGFTGNIALKVGEGVVEMLDAMLREELSGGLAAALGAALSRGAFERFRRRVDYAESGGAPLLGVRKTAVVAHGRSSARAVRSGIALAARLAEKGVVERLGEALVARPKPDR
jgi:glycerol-3-phosphate acyltransferase PlsX